MAGNETGYGLFPAWIFLCSRPDCGRVALYTPISRRLTWVLGNLGSGRALRFIQPELLLFRRSNRAGLVGAAGHPSKRVQSTTLQLRRFGSATKPMKRSALQLMVEFARFVVPVPGWRNGRR